jgi:hypothetical protein
LVAGLAALRTAFSAPINDSLDIEGLRFPTIKACLDLLPQLIEPDFPQGILILKQA